MLKNLNKILMHKAKISVLFYVLSFGLSSVALVSCKNTSVEGRLIISEVPADIPAAGISTGDSWHFLPKARIVAADPVKSGKPVVLTGDLYSACSPAISFDGRYVLFSAQQQEGEPWQIWEIDLKMLVKRKITDSEENCTDPAYLPNGRLVFSKQIFTNNPETNYALYTCNPDGTDLRQITFHPHTNFATTVLKDGRLLTISRPVFPDRGDPMYLVLRPDGTKAELFYKGIQGTSLLSRAYEAEDGTIMFIETENGRSEAGNVFSISYNRPLHSRISLSAGSGNTFRSVLPMPSGKLLVSCRTKDSGNYLLYEFDLDNKTLGQVIYDSPGYHVLEAVLAGQHSRPKKLPSEVDMGVKTGLLMCQDVNFLDTRALVNVNLRNKAKKIEVLGLDASLGEVTVEEDGSFYLKAMADTPFRIQTLDENGKVINGPCAWIWLRPNERRGCVGCHEDHELVPKNSVPLAVIKPPVIIPVHVSDVGEKEVELE